MSSKPILLCTTLFLIVSNAKAQCPSCDNYLNVIYNKVSIKRDIDFKTAFESWFFSDAFEKEVKNKDFGASVTVPLEGVPVTFGGNYESKDAWEKWRSNKGSTKWDFSKITRETFFSEIATDQSREIWLQCIKYTCATQLQILPVFTESLPDKAIYKFSYNANVLENAPRYESFVCVGGLDCSFANTTYKGKPLKRNGEAIPFIWLEGQSKGGVILNTSKGSTYLQMVSRNETGKLSSGEVTYVIQKLGDPKNNDHLEKVGEYNETKFYNGLENVKAGDCWTGHLSNDGKWCATLFTHTYTAAPQQVLKKFSASCVSGSCGFSQSESQINDSDFKTVGINIRNWSVGTEWKFHAEIYKIKTIIELQKVNLTIAENVFTAVISKPYYFPLIELNMGNRKLVFRPDGKIPNEIEILNTINDDNSTTYIFKVVK